MKQANRRARLNVGIWSLTLTESPTAIGQATEGGPTYVKTVPVVGNRRPVAAGR